MKNKESNMFLDEKKECEVGTIGYVFDFFYKQGRPIPKNLEINAHRFKSVKTDNNETPRIY